MMLADNDPQNEIKSRVDDDMLSMSHFSELNNQLKELNKKLEESERMKSHFISNIRNEIVNPFASIIGLSTHIQSCDASQLDKIKKMASMIYSEAFSLDFQLKNIFAAAEVEAGEVRLHFKRVNLKHIMESIIDSYSHELTKRNVTVNLTCSYESKSMVTDTDKLQLVLSNLLDNCIKYSKDYGKVTAAVDCEEQMVRIRIQDSGIGIDETDQLTIFDRFKRINTDINTVNSGYGLGLTVAKSMLEALGGTITLTSKKDEGTVFVVQIPEAPVNADEDCFAVDTSDILFDTDDEIF